MDQLGDDEKLWLYVGLSCWMLCRDGKHLPTNWILNTKRSAESRATQVFFFFLFFIEAGLDFLEENLKIQSGLGKSLTVGNIPLLITSMLVFYFPPQVINPEVKSDDPARRRTPEGTDDMFHS